jgi:hypothetical protein
MVHKRALVAKERTFGGDLPPTLPRYSSIKGSMGMQGVV